MADVAEPTEIADRVWTVRDAATARVCGAVAGEDGVLLVDAPGEEAVRALLGSVRERAGPPVVGVALTSADAGAGVDSLAGIARSAGSAGEDSPLPVYAHEDAAALLAHGDDTTVRTYAGVTAVDLGGRLVELLHPGDGHSPGNAVVHVPDVRTAFVGRLVGAPEVDDGIPEFGPRCFPHAWPTTLDVVLGMLAPDAVVVPGRGSPVDRSHVEQQRNEIALVSEGVREMASRGVPAAQAADAAPWPFPPGALGHAVRRGLAQLPVSGRQLPLA